MSKVEEIAISRRRRRPPLAALALVGALLVAGHALARTAEPADLCQELLAYAEKKKAGEPATAESAAPQPVGSAAAPAPRADWQGSGTQGGGSSGVNASADTQSQASAPPTIPATPGAASEPATSPHASGGAEAARAASRPGTEASAAAVNLPGGIRPERVRETAARGDRQACRDMVRTMRRAGVDLPAALIALAAYDPETTKR
jgi:hypothetical protein